MSSLGSRMTAAMKAAGFNQPQLAKVASTSEVPVSQQVIQHLLSGRNKTSGHLPAIAEALNVDLDWLATGRGRKKSGNRVEAILTGRVYSNGEIARISGGPRLSGVDALTGIDGPNVLEVRGPTLDPLKDGWLIFYGPERQRVSEDCLGKLCVVQTVNGDVFLRTIKPGTRKRHFRLESWVAAPELDIKVAWAARVTTIRPT